MDRGKRDFNPRSRVGSDKAVSLDRSSVSNFNPRSRVGSDNQSSDNFITWNISIRAPAWGATIAAINAQIDALKFQSALPRGERLGVKQEFARDAVISIRAPAWGATMIRWLNTIWRIYFNPRSRVGSDHAVVCRKVGNTLFQSALPRGERPLATMMVNAQLQDFNPRSRVGSDCNIS